MHALAPQIRAPHYILVGLKIKGVPTSLSLSLQAGSGRVFYTPDEADDYDDSDPDDDLDI